MLSRAAGRRLVIVGFWTLFGAISGLQIQLSMLDHDHSWARVVGTQMVVWGVWIAFTFAIVRLLHRVPIVPLRAGTLLVHGVVALAFGLVHTTAWVGLEFLFVPYDAMNPTHFADRWAGITLYQMPLELSLYAIVALAHHAAEASRRQRERERKAAQLEASLAQARLLALELQIQPHFLFNTLNGIGSLVRAGQNPQALSMIGGLSELLRYALDRSGGVTVPLEEEADMLGRYLEIQRLRFADRLTVDVALSDDTRRAGLPALLLQPLVENAVRHGISRSDAPGRIIVRSARAGESLVVEIFNTGPLDPLRRNGIGLSTTAARLSELYGEHGRLELEPYDGGVRARVTLPFREVK